ncbi:hypothetical protein GCM10010177_64270 [Actinomadura citrea]|nr:hypothetical protein GCM10010177_64270 [Actinomadura citrea]
MRLEQLLSTGADPDNAALIGPSPGIANIAEPGEETDVDEPELATDIEQAALEQITARIAEDLAGHELATLVSAVLTAELLLRPVVTRARRRN